MQIEKQVEGAVLQREFASMFGISLVAVRRMIARGLITGVRTGESVLIPFAEVERMLRRERQMRRAKRPKGQP